VLAALNLQLNSDHELDGAKLRVVLPDSKEADDADGAPPAGGPGRGDADETD
jgi:hypothetical protein